MPKTTNYKGISEAIISIRIQHQREGIFICHHVYWYVWFIRPLVSQTVLYSLLTFSIQIDLIGRGTIYPDGTYNGKVTTWTTGPNFLPYLLRMYPLLFRQAHECCTTPEGSNVPMYMDCSLQPCTRQTSGKSWDLMESRSWMRTSITGCASLLRGALQTQSMSMTVGRPLSCTHTNKQVSFLLHWSQAGSIRLRTMYTKSQARNIICPHYEFSFHI